MHLAAPVTIQPPSFTRQTGEVRSFQPITLSFLNVTILDNAAGKFCVAQIHLIPQPLLLWKGAAYDAAGDYTQAQAEARILELLGPDIKAGLEALFVPPAR